MMETQVFWPFRKFRRFYGQQTLEYIATRNGDPGRVGGVAIGGLAAEKGGRERRRSPGPGLEEPPGVRLGRRRERETQ